VVNDVILSASRMSDSAVRSVAKRKRLVLLNRMVSEVSSVVSDNVDAIDKVAPHLHELGHKHLCYVAGPEASWADGVRWRLLSPLE
jgi:LacI family transcriptional regulator